MFLILICIFRCYRKDSTLREITDLLSPHFPTLLERMVSISFKSVYALASGKLVSRELGTLYNYRNSKEETQSFDTLKLSPGDFLAVDITEGQSALGARLVGSAQRQSREGSRDISRSSSFELRSVDPKSFGIDEREKSRGRSGPVRDRDRQSDYQRRKPYERLGPRRNYSRERRRD